MGLCIECSCQFSARIEIIAHKYLNAMQVLDCEFHDNQAGALAIEGATMSLERCNSSGNSKRGFEVQAGASMTAIDCSSEGDGEGCGVKGTGALTAKRVTVHNSVHSSFSIWQGGSAVLENCTVTNCQDTGVLVGGTGSRAVLRRCHVSDTRNAGVMVQDGARARVKSCTVRNSKASGLAASGDGARILVQDSHIQGNLKPGVAATDTAFVKAESCEVEGNMHGLSVQGEGATMKVYNCSIVRNAQAGAFAAEHAEMHVMWCRSQGNQGAGYWAQDAGKMRSTRCSSYGDRTAFGENHGVVVMQQVSIDGAHHSGRLQTVANAPRSWWRPEWLQRVLSQRGIGSGGNGGDAAEGDS